MGWGSGVWSVPGGGSGLIDEAGACSLAGFRWVGRGPCERCGYEWHPEQDSNLRPLAPEASALSAELSGQLGQSSRVSYNHAGR